MARTKAAEATHGGAREGAGRRSVAGSSRNGAERVTCFVSPSDAAAVGDACARLGITRGELLVIGLQAVQTVKGK